MSNWKAKLIPAKFRKDKTIIPVVRLSGTIMAGGSPGRRNLNLASCATALEKAFSMKNAPCVAISLNSPGGSPVQSRLIYQRIRDLSEEKGKSVLIFVEDVAASGGYMIALAGDEIFVDPTSIVGSIGVVSGGFGFTELIRKIGVERRVYTAGENKVMLDPFQPEKERDIAYLKTLQADIHDVFTGMVKARRGAKLADDPDLFTGLFWTGRKGVELGLVDGIGDMRPTLKQRYGNKAELKLISGPTSLLGKKVPGVISGHVNSDELAAGFVAGLAETAEERALWSRYGL
ncbi:S49 family peptidase [Martelella mediterranea]|uniref:Signal peptide peptidase SppA n=1 Tax=Martelella mediterranea TaxID=293089 RepID=A0A4R3NVF2_9HYPH|nr:S49 family peptidase [Martelella mediterranea]TCT42015.1 signal peptide peptidase SppA [Martelella mediterranea]